MRREFRIRIRLITLALAAFALLLVLRLYFVQIVHGEEYSLKAERQYASASRELYDRGTIYFTRKDGTMLSAATLATGFTLAMNPSLIEDAEAAYEAVNAEVPVEREGFLSMATKKGDPYEVVAKQVPEAAGEAIVEADIPGILVERTRWRSYPADTGAAQSIGIVAYDNDDTLAGRFGLERYYEHVLARGNEGLFGNFFAELFANAGSVAGDARDAREGDLITSLEPVVVGKLQQVLAETGDRYGSIETGGLIMIPATGEIIALDTYPSFDPNAFASADPARFGNPLVEHRYEFGSIMKALTMAMGLDAGVITPSSTYEDTGKRTLNTSTIANHDGKARGPGTSMQDVLDQSLNLGAAHIALKVGHEGFREYLSALGLGEETGIDLPAEANGDVENVMKSPRDIEYATASYGQGIAATPVGMLRALSALANEGQTVTPHLVRAVRLESGVVKELNWGKPETVFGRDATEDATRMLVHVVDEALAGGSAKIEGMSVAAKTGTAQVPGPDGKYREGVYFHSFFGYFPAYEPRFIVLLYTREPHGVSYASETLTHPFMDLVRFLASYYAIPPDRAEAYSTESAPV